MAAMLPDTPDRVTHAPGGGGEDQNYGGYDDSGGYAEGYDESYGY